MRRRYSSAAMSIGVLLAGCAGPGATDEPTDTDSDATDQPGFAAFDGEIDDQDPAVLNVFYALGPKSGSMKDLIIEFDALDCESFVDFKREYDTLSDEDQGALFDSRYPDDYWSMSFNILLSGGDAAGAFDLELTGEDGFLVVLHQSPENSLGFLGASEEIEGSFVRDDAEGPISFDLDVRMSNGDGIFAVSGRATWCGEYVDYLTDEFNDR